MPHYNYSCKKCQKEIEIEHGYYEQQEICPACGEKTLQKMPTTAHIIITSGSKKSTNTSCPNDRNKPRCHSCYL